MENKRVFALTIRTAIAVSIILATRPAAFAQTSRVATAPGERVWATQRVTVNVDNVPLAAALSIISRQAGLIPWLDKTIIPPGVRVTLHVQDVAVADAFERVLQGTGLAAKVLAQGDVAIVREATLLARTGTIAGRIVSATTQQPLHGAKIGLDGVDRVTETASDGTYRLVGVSAGPHTVTVKLLGFTRVARVVSVLDNTVATADIALEASVTPLDQVVVTGTVVQTELKAVPNAITVITAKQIEERGITKIDQLFRGDVPGLFAQNQGSGALLDEVTMFSRGVTSLNANDLQTSAFTAFTNPIKTYVDGIELADPKYLSQIDPKSIERIEILTGPQASTIYGSNAINGVMQIFTKRGTSNAPQLTLNLMSGWVENNFSSARTPQHDYSAQLSGLEGRMSYNAGGTWNYMGPWTPAKQLARTGGFGGARLDLSTPAGRVTADMTLRRSITQSLQRGYDQQTWTGYRETGWYSIFSNQSPGVDRPTTRTLTGQTLGLTFSYAPARWWSHELGLGSDVSDTERRVTARGYASVSVSDTTLLLEQSYTDRRSLRYATTARLPVTSLAQFTVTAGADAWQNLTSFMQVATQTLTGSLTGSPVVSRQPGHNTGGFLQTQLGLTDRLFFTYGLRAEWNPNYGEKAQPNIAPRYGVAYTQEVGPITAKLRGSYGRSTRPPEVALKASIPFSSGQVAFWGAGLRQFANPELAPERQQGGEGGFELYLGTRGSLVVTRYNQTVDELINSVVLDSVDLLPAAKQQFGFKNWQVPQRQSEFLNVGSIRNQGWELQGNMDVGPITTRGTYSWTKSRTIGVNPKYRAQFANQAQYQPGATFTYLPEHTWAFGVTYARPASSVGLNVTGTGRARNNGDDFFFRNLNSNIRLPQNQLNISNIGGYINFNSGYALADLVASYRFASRVEGVFQVQNLADRYANDYRVDYASLGRQLKAGLRCRW